MVGQDGGVYMFGNAAGQGCVSLPGCHVTPNLPVVGAELTSDDDGYYMVGADGGMYFFGDATPEDAGGLGCVSLPGCHIDVTNATSMTVTADNGGYAIATGTGAMYNFGNSAVYNEGGNEGTPCYTPGSCPNINLSGTTIVGIVYSGDDPGYYFIASNGAIYNFGGAPQYEEDGSAACYNLPQCGISVSNIIGMALTPDQRGYWIVGSDGSVYCFGDAGYYGSLGGAAVPDGATITGFSPTPDGDGYWFVTSVGGLISYGDAAYLGSMEGDALNKPVAAVAAD